MPAQTPQAISNRHLGRLSFQRTDLKWYKRPLCRAAAGIGALLGRLVLRDIWGQGGCFTRQFPLQ